MSNNNKKPPFQPQDFLIEAEEGENHKGNLLVQDLINLNSKLWLLAEKDVTNDDHVALAKHVVDIIQNGTLYTLPSSTLVAESFFKGGGRFLKKKGKGWTAVSDEAAVKLLVELIQQECESLEKAAYGKEDPSQQKPDEAKTDEAKSDEAKTDKEEASAEQDEAEPDSKRQKTNSGKAATTTTTDSQQQQGQLVLSKAEIDDVVLLERKDAAEKTYVDHQGNAFLILELSQFFTDQYMLSNPMAKGARADAALATIYALLGPIKEQGKGGASTRFLVRPEGHVLARPRKDFMETWKILEYIEATEFVLTLLFDKLVDKENIAAAVEKTMPPSVAPKESDLNEEGPKPTAIPVKVPVAHDVLLGRGGLTNNHPGNRRFRDIILLHRPDYVRAIKVEKPNVARRIVRAIRCGSPPGRFLKKDPKNGMWYDVGDRQAAEKTSQALREKTQAEKAVRLEVEKRKRGDGEGATAVAPPRSARMHPILPLLAPTDMSRMPPFIPHPQAGLGAVPMMGPYGMAVRMPNGTSTDKTAASKGKNGGKQKEGEEAPSDGAEDKEKPKQEQLDAEGNIVVTDADILCGRGGLTNNHPGNKRFRDIVSLHRPDYVRANKIHKPAVARLIVKAIRTSDPPGRFLRKDEKTGKWYDIGDKRAAEKASQALREKSPEERDHLKHETVNGVPLRYFSNPELFNVMKGTLPEITAAVAAGLPAPRKPSPAAKGSPKTGGTGEEEKTPVDTTIETAKAVEI